MDTKFVKIRSWHAVRPDVHFGPTTYCGLDVTSGEIRDELPAEKSCEKCLRIIARIADHASAA